MYCGISWMSPDIDVQLTPCVSHPQLILFAKTDQPLSIPYEQLIGVTKATFAAMEALRTKKIVDS